MPNVIGWMICGAVLALSIASRSVAQESSVALRARWMVDVARGARVENALVVVRGDRIVAAGSRDAVPVPASARVIDLGEATLIPGLIDAHVHLLLSRNAEAAARATLFAGFTTVQDLGALAYANLALRAAIDSGRVVGPRMIAAGPWLGVSGGICDFNGIGVRGAEAFRARVREDVGRGANLIKVCVSGWLQHALRDQSAYEISDAELSATIDEAHKLGRRVAVHAISEGGIRAAVRLGADLVVHGGFADSATVQRMKERRVYQLPTLYSLSSADTVGAKALVPHMRRVHEWGVPIAFGTDAGVIQHGRNAREFAELVRIGMTTADALRAATVWAADAVGLRDSVGVLAAGQYADVVAVDGDPLADVGVLERVVFVMQRGRVRRASVLGGQSPSSSDTLHREVVRTETGVAMHRLLERYESYGYSGTVLVAHRGGVILHRGYGLADREGGIRNGPGTMFEIASLTKTFTAAAILALEEDGRLRTSDRLEVHLGPFPAAKRAATIHHLATHTGGLVVEGATGPPNASRDAFVRWVKETPTESPPGERYRYTNAGYSVLAAVIERASGTRFETFLRRRLFEHAGLSQIAFRGELPDTDQRLARGYLGPPGELAAAPTPPYPWGTRGAGGIVATVAELYRWHVALTSGRVLSEKSREKMFTAWPTEGYGWHVVSSGARRLIQKGGGMPNFAFQILHYPDDSVTIVFASNNLQQRWRQALVRGLTALAFGENVVEPPPIAPLSPNEFQRYAGTYIGSAGERIELRAAYDYLYMPTEALGLPAGAKFFPQGGDRFSAFDPVAVRVTGMRFVRSARGDIDRLVVPGGPSGEVSLHRSRGA